MLRLVIVLFFVLLALFAPCIAPYHPIAISWSAMRKAPSAQYLFGTDEIGRAVLSRVLWGARLAAGRPGLGMYFDGAGRAVPDSASPCGIFCPTCCRR